MRLVASALLPLFFFTMVLPVEAADRFWVGQGTDKNRWESTANWATTRAGAGGASIPGTSDVAIFDAGGGGVQANIRSNVSVGGLQLNSTWTGSLLQGTGSITVGSSNFKVGSGRFVGGNAAIMNAGTYTQTGGVVTGIMNNFVSSGSVSITKGAASAYSTFTSTGTIILDGNADQNFTVGATVSKTFKNLTLDNSGAGTSDDIVVNVNGGLFLSGALVITLGNLDLTTNSNALVVDGGITLADAAEATLTTNSNVTASGTITVNNAATITVTAGTWTLNDDSDQTVDLDGQSLYGLTINNTGGGTNDDIVIAADGQLNLSGALTITLGNLDLTTNTETMVVDRGITVANSAQATLTTNSNVTASGTILVNDDAVITVTGGTWTLNDDSDQTFDIDGQSIFNLTINNAGGGTNDDVTVAGGSLQLSGALTVTLGGLDLTTNSLAMITERDITLADAAQATLTTNSNVTASGTITVGDASTLTVTAGTWTLNDDSDQTVDLDGQSLYGLTINNTGGGTNDDIIIAADGQLNLSGALTITLGNLDLTTNTESMVVDRGITVANSAQATLTTNSNITASGSILVNDDAVITVTGGTWTLNDDSDQAFDIDGQSIYNLTLNNTGGGTNDDVTVAGGSLQLSGALTVTLGNLDLTTNSLAMITDRGITLADAAQATLTTNSNVTASGTITVGDASTLTVSAATWTLNDDSDQTVDLDGQSLYNVTINNTGGGTNDDIIIAADGQMNVSGALTITLGNLDLTTNTETMVVDRGITLADAARERGDVDIE
ncbi:MAG: hypothetical protein Greene041619_1208 [Candidatus Peregrinibacteria bacterium Greene0416_19]|nr:MAG: hypothetical protein Greene041619_1208 [Candidatus Peregrinibacteria bacterium Greene0416_19]